MRDDERKALRSLSFNWAPTPNDVWLRPTFHVDGLNRGVADLILDGFAEADKTADSSPIGVVVLGQRGVGKTHLLGSIRERVQDEGGYFFLITLLDAVAFWRSAAQSILDGLTREVDERPTQLATLLNRLADALSAPRTIRRAVSGESPITRASMDAFVDLLRKGFRQVAVECQDTIRALILRASESPREQDIGHTYLCSNDEVEPGDRAEWGIRRSRRAPQEIVRDMSRLIALTGPTVIAVDQIDLLINQSAKATAHAKSAENWAQSLLIEHIAGGLMSLREMTRRTLSVVTCLPASWTYITTQATDTVQDRFRQAVNLNTIGSADVARELVERRFAEGFERAGFMPPYPSWPVRPEAFKDAVAFTPRELLITIDSHVRRCLLNDELSELRKLVDAAPAAPVSLPSQVTFSQTDRNALDQTYAELERAADPDVALHSDTEDTVVPQLLEAGLKAWIGQQDDGGQLFSIDALTGSKPALHGRLRQSIEQDREDEAHWAFRAISAAHPIAALNRLRNAATAAGLTEGITKRKLFILRTDEWSPGRRTQEAVEAFVTAGGRRLAFSPDDISKLMALKEMQSNEDPERLRAWYLGRKPADGIAFLQQAFAGREPPISATAARPADEPPPPPIPTRGEIPLGMAVGGNQIPVKLEALRRHTAIFAGSGSGKTVLIRRLVEECALQGVSAIVLDPNNDLSRLGDAWPTPPDGWDVGDEEKAAQYIANTEVVVWTPRRESGRPLSFQPLPDFASIRDDPDEFGAAVDAAVAALAPRAKVDGTNKNAHLGQAVLREALRSFARYGGSDLRAFIGLLSALPEGISELDNAEKIANNMAQTLLAAMVNDPLFGGAGESADPGTLLTPGLGKRARVSVISFIGLTSDEQRQSFVNQLQLALFSWIKRHPANDRPLGGLFVMDEAQTLAPSSGYTACTASTLALASQARKYGLGLVFATQAPKGLHNQITGNAATQVFGLLSNPVQIGAAREMAKAKGSDVAEVGSLDRGEFYVTVEGTAFQKMRSPMCLSYHPSSPLTLEEVLKHARRDA
ncbi:helicase HerA domain-containing protein [Dactylosporangium matsuzakiense]|nr:DUF87 domain-containing protein [Dactylosporangium matsuzakiense]UWZ42407.1 DUF87 domain-containing protein [Dactylosporangium matsuzakiense]